MSRKKNTNWKRTVKKQAGREETQAENRRGLLRELSPEVLPAPPSPTAIEAATETSQTAHAPTTPDQRTRSS
jgi:hypothetical protein